jgi:hypothetical protein
MMLERGFPRHVQPQKARKWPNQFINATVPFADIQRLQDRIRLLELSRMTEVTL